MTLDVLVVEDFETIAKRRLADNRYKYLAVCNTANGNYPNPTPRAVRRVGNPTTVGYVDNFGFFYSTDSKELKNAAFFRDNLIDVREEFIDARNILYLLIARLAENGSWETGIIIGEIHDIVRDIYKLDKRLMALRNQLFNINPDYTRDLIETDRTRARDVLPTLADAQ